MSRSPRGREAQARRNDERILESALDVLSADPTAPMSAVARCAEVGQATLYRRYPSKQDLLAEVCERGLRCIADAVAEALAASDPWAGLTGFLTWYADSGALRMSSLLGSFAPPAALFELARSSNLAMQELVDRNVAAGALRPDVTGADLTLIATQLSALVGSDRERTSALRRRYGVLALQALALVDAPPLPGPAPDGHELEAPWRRTG